MKNRPQKTLHDAVNHLNQQIQTKVGGCVILTGQPILIQILLDALRYMGHSLECVEKIEDTSIFHSQDLFNDYGIRLLQSPNSATLRLIYQQSDFADLWIIVPGTNSKERKPKSIPSFHFERPYENEVFRLICDIAKLKGIQLSQDSARTISRYYGENLTDATNVLKTLALIDRELSPSELTEVLDIPSDDNIFALNNALLEKKADQALYFVDRFVRDGQSEIMILGIINRFLRNLIYLKSNLDSEVGRMPGFILQKYKDRAKSLSEARIQSLLDLSLKAEFELKSSHRTKQSTLNEVVMNIC